MTRPDQFGMYQGRKVIVVRPAAAGDDGWDPANKDELTLIQFAEPLEGKDVEPEILVKSTEISPTKE